MKWICPITCVYLLSYKTDTALCSVTINGVKLYSNVRMLAKTIAPLLRSSSLLLRTTIFDPPRNSTYLRVRFTPTKPIIQLSTPVLTLITASALVLTVYRIQYCNSSSRYFPKIYHHRDIFDLIHSNKETVTTTITVDTVYVYHFAYRRTCINS